MCETLYCSQVSLNFQYFSSRIDLVLHLNGRLCLKYIFEVGQNKDQIQQPFLSQPWPPWCPASERASDLIVNINLTRSLTYPERCRIIIWWSTAGVNTSTEITQQLNGVTLTPLGGGVQCTAVFIHVLIYTGT